MKVETGRVLAPFSTRCWHPFIMVKGPYFVVFEQMLGLENTLSVVWVFACSRTRKSYVYADVFRTKEAQQFLQLLTRRSVYIWGFPAHRVNKSQTHKRQISKAEPEKTNVVHADKGKGHPVRKLFPYETHISRVYMQSDGWFLVLGMNILINQTSNFKITIFKNLKTCEMHVNTTTHLTSASCKHTHPPWELEL